MRTDEPSGPIRGGRRGRDIARRHAEGDETRAARQATRAKAGESRSWLGPLITALVALAIVLVATIGWLFYWLFGGFEADYVAEFPVELSLSDAAVASTGAGSCAFARYSISEESLGLLRASAPEKLRPKAPFEEGWPLAEWRAGPMAFGARPPWNHVNCKAEDRDALLRLLSSDRSAFTILERGGARAIIALDLAEGVLLRAKFSHRGGVLERLN